MKKSMICGLLVTASVSFNANAGVLDGFQETYYQVEVWVSNVIKPTKPKW